MTAQEAKEWDIYRAIDLLKRIKREEIHERYIDRHKTFDLAIQALEEVEQYRAIGTPTQIFERIGGLDVELGKYACIGTVEELKEAREKQIPKKPNELFRLDGALKGGKCPTCGRWINNGRHWIYCECGQKIDWKEGGTSD